MLDFKGLLVVGACLMSVVTWADGSSVRTRTKQLIIELDSRVGQFQTQAVGSSSRAAVNINLPDGRQVKVLRNFSSNSLVVELPEEISLEEAEQIAAEMALRAGVVSVQPNKRFYPALDNTPNDPAYPAGFDPVTDPGQWHLFEATAGIRMPTAWDISTGSAGVVVAVLDSGIIPHSDLNSSRILPGYDFFSDEARDNDGTPGRDNDPTDPGNAVIAEECGKGEPAENSSWHGLSVVGVIMASSNNNLGIAGIDFSAQLLPIRVIGRCGGKSVDVADAIRWAAGLFVQDAPNNPTPAQVINVSLSGDRACSQFVQSAINAAVAAGSVVVAAAGNDNGLNVADVSPANCDNVIVAGAIARNGTLASYSNVGLAVDLTAPGGDGQAPGDGILTLFNTGATAPEADALAYVQGTSFATAQVSAVASLMVAVNGALMPLALEDVLKATTRSFPDASCDQMLCGTGVLNAAAALVAALNPDAIVANQAPTASVGGPYSAKSSVVISFDGAGSLDPDGGALTYTWDFGDGSFGTGVAPTHAYSGADTYPVLLIVNDGVKDSVIAATTAIIDGGRKVNTTGSGGGGCTLVVARTGKKDVLWWLVLILLAGRYNPWRKSRLA